MLIPDGIYDEQALAAEVPAAIVVLAGEPPSAGSWALARLQRWAADTAGASRPWLLGADGGGDTLADFGLTPDYLVGDGDSSRHCWPDTTWQRFPAEKNFTDGEAALRLALERTSGVVEVYGALGGRLDHLLTNIMLPLTFPVGLERLRLLHDNMEAAYCRRNCTIIGNSNDMASFIPLSPQVTGVELPPNEFKYPLHDFSAHLGSSRMVSNVLLGQRACMSMKTGLLLAIHYCE